jgi:hypothetical protein
MKDSRFLHEEMMQVWREVSEMNLPDIVELIATERLKHKGATEAIKRLHKEIDERNSRMFNVATSVMDHSRISMSYHPLDYGTFLRLDWRMPVLSYMASHLDIPRGRYSTVRLSRKIVRAWSRMLFCHLRSVIESAEREHRCSNRYGPSITTE